MKAESRRSLYQSLKLFYAWFHAAGYIEVNPALALPKITPGKPCPHPTPESAYRAALEKADARAALILQIAARMGLRRAEISQISRIDIVDDLTGLSLIVHGKGNKTRVIPLPDDLAQHITTYLGNGYWLFPGNYHGHLSPQYVGKIATRLLPPGYGLHSLCHRFASAAYAVDQDLLAVQQLLGHSSPATTQRYVKLPDNALRRAMAGAA